MFRILMCLPSGVSLLIADSVQGYLLSTLFLYSQIFRTRQLPAGHPYLTVYGRKKCPEEINIWRKLNLLFCSQRVRKLRVWLTRSVEPDKFVSKIFNDILRQLDISCCSKKVGPAKISACKRTLYLNLTIPGLNTSKASLSRVFNEISLILLTWNLMLILVSFSYSSFSSHWKCNHWYSMLLYLLISV